MIYLIVGHKGVGKTCWLKKIKQLFINYNKTVHCFDLDEQIVKHKGYTINEIFCKYNEKYFRKIEQKVLFQLLDQYKNTSQCVFIATGAGCHIPDHAIPFCHIIHLIRETDPYGRVLLDRPLLQNHKTPYQEYMSLYTKRETIYRKIKTESLVLPEQGVDSVELEKLFFGLEKPVFNISMSLSKETLPQNKKQWKNFIDKRCEWGVRFFELRDDWWNEKDLQFLLQIIPKDKQLLSFRKPGTSVFSKQDLHSVVWDWPVEKGPPPILPPILSRHSPLGKKSFCHKTLFPYPARYFKLVLPIRNWTELKQGHLWFLKDKLCRSFLPLSVSSTANCWRWYRQVWGHNMFLHFVRESREGLKDQVFLHEALDTACFNKSPQAEVSFGAVVGDPVRHSASPMYHKKLFAPYQQVFTKIPMQEKDMTPFHLNILQKLGCGCLAVTSPLKKQAFAISKKDPLAQRVGAVNTLVYKKNSYRKWQGYNTDFHGLEQLFLSLDIYSYSKIVVWGGGAMQALLQKLLPQAYFYSARTGCIKTHKFSLGRETSGLRDPQVLIWAVGRSRFLSGKYPSPAWKPEFVLDLNYAEDSPGREYAWRQNISYISGQTLFQNQARKQQEYFLESLISHRADKER